VFSICFFSIKILPLQPQECSLKKRCKIISKVRVFQTCEMEKPLFYGENKFNFKQNA
jgi:hypothetical protein